MREARIILPHFDNNGVRVDDAHNGLKLALLVAFGGYTSSNVSGAWRATNGQPVEDASTAYDVACADNDPATNTTLRALALVAGRRAKQAAVYLRYPSGAVDILNCAEPATQAA